MTRIAIRFSSAPELFLQKAKNASAVHESAATSKNSQAIGITAIRKNVILALLAIWSLLVAQTCISSNISISPGKDGEPDLIVISGEIASGDEKAFKAIALKTDSAIVILESPGGMLSPALEIGKAIRLKGFATAVINNSECSSSCALAWLAGQPRLLAKNANVGFHAAYIEHKDGKKYTAGTGNALVGSYLNALGLSDDIVRYVTTAGADEIRWLTKENADDIGLAVSPLEDKRKARANFNLAIRSEQGDRPPVDEALRLYRISADDGFAGAQNNLADMYERGVGVQKNEKFAAYMYARAAERGEPTAYLSLSTLLSDGTNDESVLIDALKFALLAIVQLPNGQNKADAESTARMIMARLSRTAMARALELAETWKPLYQEKYLMSDTPNKPPIFLDPAEFRGSGRVVKISDFGPAVITKQFTVPVRAEGKWSGALDDDKSLTGKVTLIFDRGMSVMENDAQLMKVNMKTQLKATSIDLPSEESDLVIIIDPISKRAVREVSDDGVTNFRFESPRPSEMRIGDRVHAGTLQTHNQEGVVTETGDIFEELRMSLQVIGAVEYCLIYSSKYSAEEAKHLSYDCEIFSERGDPIGLHAKIVTPHSQSLLEYFARYSHSNISEGR